MPASTELLEREEELAGIEQVLGTAIEGAGGLLTIEGEAGAGKTTLLEATAEFGVRAEMLVLRARGGEYERDFPYGVVRQLFESVLRDDSGQEDLFTGNAASAAPIFEPQAAPAEGADPFHAQHGLYWLIADLAASTPLALLVDDAQWADLASLRTLLYVGRRLDELPVALALAVRTGEPGEHERLLDELRREPAARVIVPRPLSARAAATLAEEKAGCLPGDGIATACCDATAGNPFLLVELLRALDLEELAGGGDDVERLVGIAASDASRSILARLARLGEHATEVARAVAVLEPHAEARLIVALTGLRPEEVASVGERLVVANLLTDSRPLAFIHPLVRAAVVSDMPEPRRAADHARAARALSDDGASADAVAAQLLLAEAVADDWAVSELRAAASAALARGAPEGAVRYLRRALREPPARKERLEVSRELGIALLRADDPEGIEVLRAVRSALDDPVARAEIATVVSISLAMRRPGGEGVGLLEGSLAEIPDLRHGIGLDLRAQLLFQAIAGLEYLPEKAMPDPDEMPAADSLEGRGVLNEVAFINALGLGAMAHARELAERALADPAAIEASTLAGFPPHFALAVLALCDRGDAVAKPLDLTIDAAKRRGTLPGVASGHGTRGYCHLVDGELREAQADLNIAIRLIRPTGLRVQLANWLSGALRTLVSRGDPVAAQGLLDEVWRGREPGPGIPGALMLVGRGGLRHATGRHAEARHDFLAASERVKWLPYANPEVLGWRAGLALAEAALGNAEEARRLAEEATRLAREAGGQRGIGIALRIQGAVTEGAEGVELLQGAADVLGGTRARLQHAHALADLGAALRRVNRRKDAREPLREALDLAHRCGAAPLEERVRTELTATGARPRKSVLSGVESLTASELRVAGMAAEGMTNREIARALTVTEKTVETHMRHVFQKLDIERRTELPATLQPA